MNVLAEDYIGGSLRRARRNRYILKRSQSFLGRLKSSTWWELSLHSSKRPTEGIISRFLLVIANNEEFSATKAAKQLCGSFSDIVELRSSGQAGINLVRPDGYIAYSVHNDDSIAALATVRSLLERQTDSTQLVSVACP